MMTRASMVHMKRLLVGGVAAALLAGGCSEDPALYLGGPPGPTTSLELSTSRFTLRAGEPQTLGAQARDQVGNPTGDAVSFTSCDAAMVSASATGATEQWSQVASVTGVGLGNSCVVVTAGGVADTVRVAVGPSSIVIAGPDTVLSGVAGIDYVVELYDRDGNQLTPGTGFPIAPVVSVNPLRLPITETGDLTYTAAGQQPGNVTLQTSTTSEFGGAAGVKVVTVVPGVFDGTVNVSTAAQGGAVVVTAGTVAWDGDVTVLINGVMGSNWDGTAAGTVADPSSGSLTFLVPWSLAPGTYDLIVVNQGPGQVSQRLTGGFTVTAGTPVNNRQPYAGANTPGTDLRARLSLDRPLAWPVVFDPAVTASVYSYYTLNNSPAPSGNAGEVVLRMTLDWVDSCGATCDESADEDVDIEIIDGGFTAYLDLDAATLGKPEVTHFNFQENTLYIIRYHTYSAAAATHAVAYWLGNGTLCADNGGCVIGGVP